MSLLGRVITDHLPVRGDELQCKAKDVVVISDTNPPGRHGDCLCSLNGKTGFIPRSKVNLVGFVQSRGEDPVNALEESPIYEVPPGAMPSDRIDRSRHMDQLHAISSLSKPQGQRSVNGAAYPRDAEYVVFVDEKLAATKTLTPPSSRRHFSPHDKSEGQEESLPMSGGVERQLVVKEGTGGHPSPILRHKSSLRSAQAPRRHSSTSVPETPQSAGSSNSPSRPVLRWADSPRIIEIPSDHSYRMDEVRHRSEGDYDDLNVATNDDSQTKTPLASNSHPECGETSKHSAAIHALLRNFNPDSLRTADVNTMKVLLERIHWYIEDCSNRLLRFIRPRWKTSESLAVTIPSLYDACNLYHSMSQVFTTYVYVCLEKASVCEDKNFAKKLLKHLNPLEKHRQVYNNCILCLDSLQWQPTEIQRLSRSPVTDYLGDIIASLRDINIEERSLYTALISNLELLFQDKSSTDVPDLNLNFQQFSINRESSQHVRKGPHGFGHEQAHKVYNSPLPTTHRIPQPKPPIVPVLGNSPPSRYSSHYEAVSEHRTGSLQNSVTSPIRPLHSFSRNGNAIPVHCDVSVSSNISSPDSPYERHYVSAYSTSPIGGHRPPVLMGSQTTRRHSALSFEESSFSGSSIRPAETNLSYNSSTSPNIYSPPSSSSTRGSGDSFTIFDSHSNGRGFQDLRIQMAKVESHVEVVLTAVGNLLQCISHEQPPNVFVQHSKFVVVSAQKLLTISDQIGNHANNSDHGQQVLALTNQLCEQLKLVVSSTKEAAMRHPSREATQQMLSSAETVANIARKLKIEVSMLAQI